MKSRLPTWSLLLTLVLGAGFAIAEDQVPPRKVTVQIGIFSGMPDPAFALEDSEVAEYRRLRTQFRDLPIEEQQTFRTYRVYRGMEIRESGLGDIPISVIFLNGPRIVRPEVDENGEGRWRLQQLAPDNALELYLLNLARDKRAINDEVRSVILQNIKS